MRFGFFLKEENYQKVMNKKLEISSSPDGRLSVHGYPLDPLPCSTNPQQGQMFHILHQD